MFLEEIKLIYLLSIKFIEFIQSQNNLYLVYEFCNGITLEDIFHLLKH